MQRLLSSWRPRTTAWLALSSFVSLTCPSPSLAFPHSSNTCPSRNFSASHLVSTHTTRPPHKMADASDDTKSNSYTVAIIPCLNDNYGFLLHSEGSGETAAIDTPDAAAYQKSLEKHGWTLTHIFNTHHHWDHTGGNLELKKDGVQVYGPLIEKDKIPGIDKTLQGGDEFTFGTNKCKVIDVGGHTVGHIAYHFPAEKFAFVGDSLFSLGCGRMFEGQPDQFWASLKRLRELPDETTIYCAHEYTESNGKFALSVEPNNSDLQVRLEEVKELRAKGEPSIPTLLGVEKKTNPFLRVDVSEELRTHCHIAPGDSDAEAFAKVRKAKDNFK